MPDFVKGLFAVLLVTILISTLFFYAFNVKGPWNSFWTFFLVVLLCIWIANLWIQPIGPVYYGIGWITLISVGLLVALLLAAVPRAPHQQDHKIRKQEEARPDPESEKKYQDFNRTTATISGIFWVLMLIMLVVIILGYAI